MVNVINHLSSLRILFSIEKTKRKTAKKIRKLTIITPEVVKSYHQLIFKMIDQTAMKLSV
jgi:hypothetical protein